MKLVEISNRAFWASCYAMKSFSKGILLLLLVSHHTHCATSASAEDSNPIASKWGTLAVAGPVATIEPSHGGWSFFHIGTLHPESSSQLVSFIVHVPDYISQGYEYQDSIRAAVGNSSSFLYTKEVKKIDQYLLRAEIESMSSYAKFSVDNQCKKRSLLDYVLPGAGIVLGIGNTFLELDTRRRLNSVEEKQEAIIKAEDQQKDVITDNTKNVRTVGAQVNKLSSEVFVSHVTRGYDHLKRVYGIVKSVMGQAIHNQLSPAASEIWNMQEVYNDVVKELAKSGRRPAFKHWQSMLSMPVNWYGSPSGDFHIVLQIPTVHKSFEASMNLFQSVPGPVFVNNTFIQFSAKDDFVAHNPATGELASLTKLELEKGCTNIGTQFYCHNPLVKSQNGKLSTCLTSLYVQDFSQVARQCVAHAMPLVDSVFPSANNSFLILSQKADNVFVHCNGGAVTQTLHIPKGLSKMTIRNRCHAQSSNWRTSAGTPKSLQKTIQITKDNLHELAAGSITPVSKLHLVDTPQELKTVQDYYESQKWSHQDYLLIAISVCLAVVICLLVVGGLIIFLLWKRIQQQPQNGQE